MEAGSFLPLVILLITTKTNILTKSSKNEILSPKDRRCNLFVYPTCVYILDPEVDFAVTGY